ncbi:MAG: hypothetical protein ACYDC5_06705 [Candidatus Dormibacteria bacterium]
MRWLLWQRVSLDDTSFGLDRRDSDFGKRVVLVALEHLGGTPTACEKDFDQYH